MKFKKVESFSEHYTLGKDLGAGAFGQVMVG